MFLRIIYFSLVVYCCFQPRTVSAQFLDYTDHYVLNEDVRLHYVTKGSGPVILFLHGFPDFWFTWKTQMDFFSKNYTVVGMDLRGYNYSDAPQGVDNYKMGKLIADVVTVIKNVSTDPVIIVANDWGGAIAWLVATYAPDKVSALVACNIPHPSALRNYLNNNPSTADYTKKLKSNDVEKKLSVADLMKASHADSSELKVAYQNAFNRSSIRAMTDYYKASYPSPSSKSASAGAATPAPKKISCPVLIIHGLSDNAFPPGTLNDHWNWVQAPITIHTIPGSGHFIQRERPLLVLELIDSWISNIVPLYKIY